MTQVLTANDLHSGEPVFGGASGWVVQLADAHVLADSEEADRALEAARAQTTVVVDPYLVDVEVTPQAAIPVSFRERVRALGPPAHPDMGKQAIGGPAVAALQRARGSARSAGRTALIARKK